MEKVTVEYEVYTFDELSEEAQENALEAWNDNNPYVEMQWDVDTLTEVLTCLNLPDVEIYYSGFWSQGDGLCFTMSATEIRHIDLKKLEKLFSRDYWEWAHKFAEEMNCITALEKEKGIVVTSTHHGNYYHENSVTIDVEPLDEETMEDWTAFEETEEKVIQLFRELMQEMYSILGKHYAHYSSKEFFAEMAGDSGWRFLKSGKQFD